MEEDGTAALVRRVIDHAANTSEGRGKGVSDRLAALGYRKLSQQAISKWRTKGTGLTADRFLALARDLQLDMNALLYEGRVVGYDIDADRDAKLRLLREALAAAQRALDLADKRED